MFVSIVIEYFWSKENDAFGDVYSNIEGKRSVLVHKGYITLFPFLFGLLDSSKSHRLKSTLDMLSDPQELWSDYGIRSLSLSDEYHGKGENYWRGAIWINMNYLVIRSLSKVYFRLCVYLIFGSFIVKIILMLSKLMNYIKTSELIL